MKLFITISAFALVGIVAANGWGKGPSTSDILVRRGMILQDLATRTMAQLKEQKRGNFVYALENELVLIEAVMADLMKHGVFTEERKSEVEKKLLILENRVGEKLTNIKKAIGDTWQHN